MEGSNNGLLLLVVYVDRDVVGERGGVRGVSLPRKDICEKIAGSSCTGSHDCMGLSRMEDMTVQGGEASRYGTVYNCTTSMVSARSPQRRIFIT